VTVREQIVARIQKCGYDIFAACEYADKCLAEFKSSGKSSMRFGIMGAHGKCADAFEINRKGAI